MFKRASALFAALVVTTASSAAAQNVSIELGLLVDVSGSIDNSEFNLQKSGYVNAFTSNSTFWNTFAASGRSLAVTFAYWAGENQQLQIGGGTAGWWLITDNASAVLFGNKINDMSRPFTSGGPALTAPGSALDWFLPKITNNSYTGAKKIIDVSGDGCENDGVDTNTESNQANAAGVVINGLTIGNDRSNCGNNTSLPQWYTNNVLTPTGFLVQSADFASFGASIQEKIGREVSTGQEVVPEPATMTLLATGLAGMAAARRRRRNA